MRWFPPGIGAVKKRTPVPLRTVMFEAQTSEVLAYMLGRVGGVRMRGITPDYPAEADSLERRIAAAVAW